MFRRSFLPFSNFRASRPKKHATYVLHSVVLFLIVCPSFLHLYLFSFHNVAPLLRRVRRLNLRVPFASVFNNRHVSLLVPCDFQIGCNPEILLRFSKGLTLGNFKENSYVFFVEHCLLSNNLFPLFCIWLRSH